MSNTAGTAITTTTAAAAEKGTDVEPADRPELLDVTLRWSDLGLFLACYVAMVAVWVGIGELIVRSDSIQARDQSIAEWFVDSRTATLDTLSALGSNLAATMVKIAVTAVLAIVMRLVWKRWREPLMMVVPLVLEASVFITVTYLVARPDPTSSGSNRHPSTAASRRGTSPPPPRTAHWSSSCTGTSATASPGLLSSC